MMNNLPEFPDEGFHVDTTCDKFGQIQIIFDLPFMKKCLLLNSI